MAYPGTCLLGLALLISAFLMLSPAAGAGQYYRWVDENGVTQFSDSPPDENMKPRDIPESNSSMPIRRNNAVKRQKLALSAGEALL